MFDRRDPQFIPEDRATVALDVDFSARSLRRRKGPEKQHTVSMKSSCLFFDGTEDYCEFDHHADFNLLTAWTVEFGCHTPKANQDANASLLWKGTSAANSIGLHCFYRTADRFIVATFHTTTPETVTMVSSGTYDPDTDYYVSIRRNGTACVMRINGAEAATATIAGANNPNVATTGRLILGAQASSAAGTIATGQYYRGKIGEVRWWNVARTNAQIDDNSVRQLLDGDDTGLLHYWDMRTAPNRRIVRERTGFIAAAGRVTGFVRPCRRVLVPPEYPYIGPPATVAGSLVPPGGAAARFDGFEQYDQFTPEEHAENVLDVTYLGVYQWCVRYTFVAEALDGTLLDWTDGATIGLRLTMAATGLITGTTNIGGSQTVATTVAAVVGTPYVLLFNRYDDAIRIRLYNRTSGALVDDQSAVVGAGAGAAVTDQALRIGADLAGTDFFRGANGECTVFRIADIATQAQDVVLAEDMVHAVIHVGVVPVGIDRFDSLTDVILTHDSPATDEDFPCGAYPSDCVQRIVPSTTGYGLGIYDYQKSTQVPTDIGVMREWLIDFAGTIRRSPNLAGVDCDWEVIRRGRTDARTLLTSWAQYEDNLAILNGVDGNLLYDNLRRITKLGIEPPATASTLAEAVGGSLTLLGEYDYIVTFFDPAQNHESDPSPVATITLTGANNRVNLSAIPTSSDPDRPNMWRRIYRSQWSGIGGGTKGSVLYRLDPPIRDNTTTTYTDNTADSALTADLAIQTDEDGFYVNGVPPICRFGVVHHNELYLGGDSRNPTVVYKSRIDDIQAFPALYFFDTGDFGTGDPLTGMAAAWGRVFAFTENTVTQITPAGRFEDYAMQRVLVGYGASGHWGIVFAQGALWWWNAGEKRLYAWSGAGLPKDMTDEIDGTVDDLTADAIPFMVGVYDKDAEQILWTGSTLAAGAAGGSLESTERIPNNNLILRLDLAALNWSRDQRSVNVIARGEEPVNQEDRIYSLDYYGFFNLEYENENDYYAGSGDRYGTVDSFSANTVTLLDEAGNAAALYTTGDGLLGVPFFLRQAGVWYRGTISRTNTSATVYVADLSVTPAAGDIWVIGGIDFQWESAELDFEAAVHFKRWLYAALQHRNETGYTQGAAVTNRAEVSIYQDRGTTSSPAAQEINLRSGYDKRLMVNRSGTKFRVGIRAPYANEPVEIQSLIADWNPQIRRIPAT